MTTTGNHIADYPYTPEDIYEEVNCDECTGNGWVYIGEDPELIETCCPKCKGKGVVYA